MVKTNTVHILTRNHEFPTNIHLKESFNTLGYKVDFINPYTTSFHIESRPHEDIPEIVINRCGGLGFDDADLVLCQAYQAAGSFIINPPESIPIFRNKDQQLTYLKGCGFQIVPSLINRSELISDEQIELLDSHQAKAQRKQRYILKNIRGQAGKGVIRIEGRQTLRDLVQTRNLMGDQRYIIQPFLPVYKEYRVFFAGDNAISALVKTGLDEGQKLNLGNASFDQLNVEELPKQISDHLTNLGRIPLFFYCADFIQTSDTHGGHFYLLEVNTFPGIDGVTDRHKLVSNLILNYRNYVKHS